MHTHTRRGALAALVTFGLVAAACGDDDDSSGAATTAATTHDSVATTSGVAADATSSGASPTTGGASDTTAGNSAGPATGDPVKVMVIGELESQVLSVPEIVDGVEAAAQEINASGGIAGHPVEVLSCNTQADPNEAGACARKAVDEGVIAAVGTLSIMADAIVPVLEEAGIPMVGTAGITPLETVSPIAFPTAGGILTTYAGIPIALNEYGDAPNISIVHLDTESGRRAAGFAELGVELTGASLVRKVPIPEGAADIAPQVANAAEGADGIAVVLAPQDTGKFYTELANQGRTMPTGNNGGGLPPALADSLGSAVDGAYISNANPPVTALEAPGIQQFNDAMAGAGFTEYGDLAADRWLALHVLADAMEGADTVDAATVLERMGQIEDYSFAWLEGYTTTQECDFEGFTRVFNTKIYVSKWDGGELKLVDGPLPTIEC